MQIKLSKAQWKLIGQKAGWTKQAQTDSISLKQDIIKELNDIEVWNEITIKNFKEWADAYSFSREDLAKVLWEIHELPNH